MFYFIVDIIDCAPFPTVRPLETPTPSREQFWKSSLTQTGAPSAYHYSSAYLYLFPGNRAAEREQGTTWPRRCTHNKASQNRHAHFAGPCLAGDLHQHHPSVDLDQPRHSLSSQPGILLARPAPLPRGSFKWHRLPLHGGRRFWAPDSLFIPGGGETPLRGGVRDGCHVSARLRVQHRVLARPPSAGVRTPRYSPHNAKDFLTPVSLSDQYLSALASEGRTLSGAIIHPVIDLFFLFRHSNRWSTFRPTRTPTRSRGSRGR